MCYVAYVCKLRMCSWAAIVLYRRNRWCTVILQMVLKEHARSGVLSSNL